MNIRTTYPAVLFAVLLIGGFLLPVQAEKNALAYGQTNATLGCDKTPEGLKVTVLDQVFRNELRVQHGIDIALGDPCLSALVAFPPPFPSLLTVAHLTQNGASETVDIPDCLIWIIEGSNVTQSEFTVPGLGTIQARPRPARVLACDVDANGGLVTTLLDTPEGPDHSQIGNRCGSTLGALTAQGMQARSPITGVLGFDAMGAPVGGLMWVLTKQDDIEVLECNLNAGEDQLLVTYRETLDGVDTTAVGEPCLASIAASEELGFTVKAGGETHALPQTHTSDPGCLVWDLDGGIILE